MKKIIKILILSLFVILNVSVRVVAETSNFRQQIYAITECNDGIDNDDDGGIDFAFDEQCLSWEDDSELIDESEIEEEEEPEEEIDEEIDDNENEFVDNIDNFEIIEQSDEENDVSVIERVFTWEPLSKVLGNEVFGETFIDDEGNVNKEVIEVSVLFLVFLVLILIRIISIVYRKNK